MFARLRSPRLADLRLDWPAGVTPEWVSPLLSSAFDGDTVNVFALLRQVPGSELRGELRLLGKRSGEKALQEISCAAFAGELEAADTLPRLAASARFHAAGDDATGEALQLALAYQLLTDQTNFLLVHERSDSEKATDMPALQKVIQMVPAGWGGTGSVLHNRGVAPVMYRLAGPQYKLLDHRNPRYWTKSAHYTGLTPLGLSKWLRVTPPSEWPTTYRDLQKIGIGEEIIDWLISMVFRNGTQHADEKVIEAFLYLMSRQATHNTLAKSKGLYGSAKALALRLKGLFASEPATAPASVDRSLVEAMAVALNGMTAGAWPDQVLSLEGVADDEEE
jgi:Ca-activated chloride channel family protein